MTTVPKTILAPFQSVPIPESNAKSLGDNPPNEIRKTKHMVAL